jgi:hypothetical protein
MGHGGITPLFLTWALGEDEWPASCSFHFTPKESYLGTHLIRGWVDPRGTLDSVEKKQISYPFQESKSGRLGWAHCYTEWLVCALNIALPKTPWPEFVSELHQPSDRCLSTKLVPIFVNRGCHVVSLMDPYGRILGFLHWSRYFFFQVAPQLYS